MLSTEICSRFLNFFRARDHKIIPSSSLLPVGDPSALFTTAGMQPLAPYLLGEPHPAGRRLANIQKCVRTQDIDEVGDNTHDTFFEMLGNWSLGDPGAEDRIGAGYFKTEAISWSYELLTSRSEGFGLDPNRLYVTCFAGDDNAPRDEEAAAIWRSLGFPADRIYFLPAKNNWWSAGDNGPCGPDTEMFYDLAPTAQDLKTPGAFLAADAAQSVVEIWNDVFMEYEKRDGRVIGKLKQKNVDTGAGLERLATVLQGKTNIFDTDLFAGTMEVIRNQAKTPNVRAERIIADHVRTAVFLIADGVIPGNIERGYVLRRLLRRAVRYADKLKLPIDAMKDLVESVIAKYEGRYPELKEAAQRIKSEIQTEESRFRETLERGLKEFSRGADPFVLVTTYGFPLELIKELAREEGKTIDEQAFKQKMLNHQKISRAGGRRFKGGLADDLPKTIELHTAHHLTLAALQKVLGPQVKQRGSNIDAKRLRMDFSHPQKLTDGEKKQVEDIVNQKIKDNWPVVRRDMSRVEAEKLGAEMEFGAKYGDTVSVYFIENGQGEIFSKEFCGGPHVGRTGEIEGTFEIIKEEAVSAGVRRIKAVIR